MKRTETYEFRCLLANTSRKRTHSLLLFVFGNLRRQICLSLERAMTPFSSFPCFSQSKVEF